MAERSLEARILTELAADARLCAADIAVRLGEKESDVAAAVAALERSRAIVGYTALADWDKVGLERVQALIEVRVSPQRELGFDAIASSMHRFAEVRSCYLMSGGFDIMLIVEAESLKKLAMFVSEKLSVLDGVLSTATHFVLKKYKTEGVTVEGVLGDHRLAVSP